MDDTDAIPPERVRAIIGDRIIYVETTAVDDERDVSATDFHFSDFTDVLRQVTESIAESIGSGMRKVQPDKVSLEIGCEVSVESGRLTAMLVKGSAKANLKVTLEWSPARPQPPENQ